MSYKLEFGRAALKEWRKLDNSLRTQFKNKLEERLSSPHVASDKLRKYEAVYKIKLRRSGYRLIYQVREEEIVVIVVAIGKREKEEVYKKLDDRIG